MQLELGSIAAQEVHNWTRFARRVVCELRAEAPDLLLSEDLLSSWSDLIDALDSSTGQCEASICWSHQIDAEIGEFMLHGIHCCLGSQIVAKVVTKDEAIKHAPFTLHLVQAFMDGLEADDPCHRQLVDHLRVTLAQIQAHHL